MEQQVKTLKIAVLVQSFVIVALAGVILLRDDESISSIEPAITQTQVQPQVELEPAPAPQEIVPQVEEVPLEVAPLLDDVLVEESTPPQEDTFVEVVHSLLELADEDGYVIENGVLVKYFGSEDTITIPESVYIIGEESFSECKTLTNLTIPDNVTTIGDRAFSGCSELTYLTYTNSITSVGEDAFVNTTWFDNLNQEYNIIGDGVLIKYIENSNTAITLPNTVKTINTKAFDGCGKLKSITIPDGVTSIGAKAFAGCWSLDQVDVPSSVEWIGDYVFVDTNWFNQLEDEFTIINNTLVAYQGNNAHVLVPSTVNTISAEVFKGFNAIENLIIPDSVTYIGENAFADCINLMSLSIPNSVGYIGAGAFDNIPWNDTLSDEFNIVGDGVLLKYTGNNANVIIPDTVKTIVKGAFYDCHSMVSLTIPDSVVNIDTDAFDYNNYVENIYCNDQYIVQPIINKFQN